MSDALKDEIAHLSNLSTVELIRDMEKCVERVSAAISNMQNVVPEIPAQLETAPAKPMALTVDLKGQLNRERLMSLPEDVGIVEVTVADAVGFLESVGEELAGAITAIVDNEPCCLSDVAMLAGTGDLPGDQTASLDMEELREAFAGI